VDVYGNLAPAQRWMFMAIWHLLSGGFFTFGASINSGRVFMLVLHVLSSIVLYFICKKITDRRSASLFAVLLFSLSPLGIYFQRRVLLDNIMTFWSLLSFALVLYYNKRLSLILLSAMTLGIAILTKENAIFFVPVLFYWIYITAEKKTQSICPNPVGAHSRSAHLALLRLRLY
jgi:4-amino-4-deoxy-L-arabinose transferase-like glycosyltransferase